jgi:hypothetical protein
MLNESIKLVGLNSPQSPKELWDKSFNLGCTITGYDCLNLACADGVKIVDQQHITLINHVHDLIAESITRKLRLTGSRP